MTNGKVSFEIDGIKRSLYFGMVATEIVEKKTFAISNAGEVNLSGIRAFSYIIYGGLCNQAELMDNPYPKFDDAYELTEKIVEQGEELQSLIYNTWANTKPGKDMLARLPKPEPELTPSGKKKSKS